MISTGDDQIAIKGGHWVENLTIAHMPSAPATACRSAARPTAATLTPDGVMHRGVQKFDVYDLTIDADSRPVGHEAHAADFNGIRVKSDESRGGAGRPNHLRPTSACATW